MSPLVEASAPISFHQLPPVQSEVLIQSLAELSDFTSVPIGIASDLATSEFALPFRVTFSNSELLVKTFLPNYSSRKLSAAFQKDKSLVTRPDLKWYLATLSEAICESSRPQIAKR